MKLLGERTITRRGEGGPFHCPTCGEERESQVTVQQHFATFCGLPLFARGETRRGLRCRHCGNSFPVSRARLSRP